MRPAELRDTAADGRVREKLPLAPSRGAGARLALWAPHLLLTDLELRAQGVFSLGPG